MSIGERCTAPVAPGAAAADPPLHGVRVLDLTRLLPGPMCTLYLADLGADVIKIEDTKAGDYARSLRPNATSSGAGMSAPGRPRRESGPKRVSAEGSPTSAQGSPVTTWYRAINRNKRSLSLDLKSPAGREAFLALARDADVVVEGFRPGVVAALGIDDGALRDANPRIVYCSLSGYGQSGPRSRAAGHDVNYLGYAGVVAATGARGGPPALASLQIADLLGGAATAAIAILGALFGALRTGTGRYVDVAMADSVLAHQVFALGALDDDGEVASRGDDLLTGGVPCYGVYETRDGGFMAVGALEAKFWERACATLGREDFVAAQFARGDVGARVRDELSQIFRSRTRDEWTATFAHVDCCVTPVLSFDEALIDPQFAARQVVQIDASGRRAFAPPFALSPLPRLQERAAPRQGEHSREVLREAGYDDATIDALIASGVVR